jgi:hypothetical protein
LRVRQLKAQLDFAAAEAGRNRRFERPSPHSTECFLLRRAALATGRFRPQCLTWQERPPMQSRPAKILKKMFYNCLYTVVSHAHSSQGIFDEGFTRIYIGRIAGDHRCHRNSRRMLLTVVSRVRSRVQAVCCLNNLQQWGNATHIYALDNDGLLPPDGRPPTARSRDRLSLVCPTSANNGSATLP